MLHQQEYLADSISTDASCAFFRALVVSASILVFSMTAFGQCQEGVNTYSDVWVWGEHVANITDGEISGDSNQPAAVFHVAGSGTIDAPYNSCGHEYSVVSTTLVSPTGRTSQGSDYADLDFSDPFDQGDYSTESFYETFCPIANNSYSAGYSSVSLPAGVSITCFYYVGTIREFVGPDGTPKRTVLYRIVNPCDASCKANTATYTFPWAYSGSPRLVSAEPYVGVPPFNVCSHIASVEPTNQCESCFDLNLP